MLMTPGPTQVPEEARQAMSQPLRNPDISPEFMEFYHSLEDKLKDLYRTEDDILVLGGEGILGLEASIASLIEKGDKVLCISNGIFGDGFADFVEMHGGEPIMCSFPYDQGLDKEDVKSLLEEHDFKAATMVHCETPTGTLNSLSEVLPLLKDEGVITIVDAVSSLGGTPVPVDEIDICLCASQKCLSSPPGLTIMSVSDYAWDSITARDPDSFYTSLVPWKEMWLGDEFFPYTHLESNIYALDESVNMILDEGLENVFDRHDKTAELCRERGKELGLPLYPKDEDLCSPTVTAFHVEGVAQEVQQSMNEDHDILLATSLGELENDILRVGHMGYNADEEKVEKTMDALGDVLEDIEI